MSKLLPAALLSVLATVAAIPQTSHAETAEVHVATPAPAKQAAVKAKPGQMLYDVAGKPIGAIASVDSRTSIMLMLNDRPVTVPRSTLSMDKRKLVTSLTRSKVADRR